MAGIRIPLNDSALPAMEAKFSELETNGLGYFSMFRKEDYSLPQPYFTNTLGSPTNLGNVLYIPEFSTPSSGYQAVYAKNGYGYWNGFYMDYFVKKTSAAKGCNLLWFQGWEPTYGGALHTGYLGVDAAGTVTFGMWSAGWNSWDATYTSSAGVFNTSVAWSRVRVGFAGAGPTSIKVYQGANLLSETPSWQAAIPIAFGAVGAPNGTVGFGPANGSEEAISDILISATESDLARASIKNSVGLVS